MKKILLVLFAVMPLFTLAAQQKYALIIGNGAYMNTTRLNNPVNDAGDISAVLRDLGFAVELLTNAGRVQMEEAVIRLKNRLGAARGSYGFFYYAGHGVQSNGENYLIPVDANIPSEAYLRDRSVSMQAVLDELNAAGNALNIVVLDACRDNPFSWRRSGSRGLQVVSNQPADSIIVYATGAGSTAADGTGRNGLFTSHLLSNLKKPGLSIRDVFDQTGADVRRASGGAQIPAIYSQFFEVAYLGTRPSAVVPQPVPAPSPAPRPAPVRPAAPAERRPRAEPRDLMAEFGVRDVAAAFNAIHNFLQGCNNGPAAGRAERIRERIIAGDWLDLPRLTVRGDEGGGAFDGANVDLGAHGTLLRLIVVGIDSFTKTNAGAPAHVVFQFQNLPVEHRMNPGNTNAGGYAQSEMRRYLTGNFLAGLTAAGLPESVIYAPTRYIADGGSDARGADAPADKIWLPTEREIRGDRVWAHERHETAENQARLEYYGSDAKRIKYNPQYNGNYGRWYWLASPYAGSAAYFCVVATHGYAGNSDASAVGGCAPAFCVR